MSRPYAQSNLGLGTQQLEFPPSLREGLMDKDITAGAVFILPEIADRWAEGAHVINEGGVQQEHGETIHAQCRAT